MRRWPSSDKAIAGLYMGGKGGIFAPHPTGLNRHVPAWWNGRHRGLKIPRPRGRAGSSPAAGTSFSALACWKPEKIVNRGHENRCANRDQRIGEIVIRVV